MTKLKRRLTDLWRRELPGSSHPRLAPFSEQMEVTIREPMHLSGAVLLPGKYSFRRLGSGAAQDLIEIFNEDQTRLIATLPAGSDN